MEDTVKFCVIGAGALGYSAAEVEALLRDGVLYAEPAMSALRSGDEA